MQNFNELKLASPLQKALATMKFEKPTPIQAQAIPVALAGKDLLACAQTGTGKTAAFGIPMITRLMENKNEMALILVPTRELAAQVSEVLIQLALYIPQFRIVNLIGGMSMQPQLRSLQKGYSVIVATPGRLLDHMERRSVSLAKLSILTLDEADRMLDMGFAPQLRQIFKHLPKSYQTLLFSATLPENILSMTKEILENPTHVKVGTVSSAAPLIEQKIKELRGEQKNEAVVEELKNRQGTVLIFARTQHRTDRLCKYLEKAGVAVARIHGGRSQGQRTRALDDFRSEAVRVLVATDIAARGIDIDHVAHVINFDLPQVAEDYVHRIGRTGRNGRTGEAISLVSGEEKPLWREIQKLLAKKNQTATHTPSSAKITTGDFNTKSMPKKAPPAPSTGKGPVIAARKGSAPMPAPSAPARFQSRGENGRKKVPQPFFR